MSLKRQTMILIEEKKKDIYSKNNLHLIVPLINISGNFVIPNYELQ